MTSLDTDLVFGPDRETIEQIVSDVFIGMLAEEAAPPFTTERVADVLPVLSTVSVTGGWQGHVVVMSSLYMARDLAARLLMMAPDELNDADIADAMGELANVIGGNVKSVMPGPSALSLPSVTLGNAEIRLPGSVEVQRLDLEWQGEPLCVSVWAADAAHSG